MQNEKQFLGDYSTEAYPRPSVTADVVVFKIRSQRQDNFRKDPKSYLSVLLIKRGGHPFIGHWALPGGFLSPGETIEECALREIKEETSVEPASLMSIGMFSEPGRDPRGWIISNAFVSVIGSDGETQRYGDDASDAQWFDISLERQDDNYLLNLSRGDLELNARLAAEKSGFGMTSFKILDSGGLAFDHARIIAQALSALRSRAGDLEFIFDFLPEKFTLTELQNVQEAVTNTPLLSANFRRKAAGMVEETGEYTDGAGHRPAMLFRRKRQ